eukprot:3257385-Pyramimonas_sp.AAC.1
MLPDGKMVFRGRETRAQFTTRPDHILPEHWKTYLVDSKRRILSMPKISNKLVTLVNEPHFERGPDRTNKPNIS